MNVEIIDHPSGDQLPILLDSDGLPIPMPSEFLIGRRALGINTLVRNLRELSVLYRWLVIFCTKPLEMCARKPMGNMKH